MRTAPGPESDDHAPDAEAGVSEEAELLVAAAIGAVLSAAIVPVAARVAYATGSLDTPRSYREHLRPTPYLGGFAVVLAFAVASIAAGGELRHLGALLGGTGAMLILGTIDDRVGLPVGLRLIVQVATATLVTVAGISWQVFDAEWLNGLLTVGWIVGITNAFNLMDNLDGAAGSVAVVTAIGTGVTAVVAGHGQLAAVAGALAGACAGFLPYNLSRPSRIFLGDGGSTSIGFAMAVLIASVPGLGSEPARFWALILLAGAVLFDTALVTVSRISQGKPVFTGSRDHISHRLHRHLGTPLRVALALASAQAAMCALAVVLYESATTRILVAAGVYITVAAGVLGAEFVRERHLDLPAEQ
jgi:UDP-GlcNAc:undecaprenyl-phosphate GlcNAc-1-phosphate transferase